MANKNRNKGNYHEKEIVKWLNSLDFKAKRHCYLQKKKRLTKNDCDV